MMKLIDKLPERIKLFFFYTSIALASAWKPEHGRVVLQTINDGKEAQAARQKDEMIARYYNSRVRRVRAKPYSN